MENRYTVQEIDEMRSYVRQILSDKESMRSYPSSIPSASEIEEQLRTYMLHGTKPDELSVEADRVRKLMIEDME